MTKWIITRKQLPTEADGDKNGEVLAVVEEPPPPQEPSESALNG